MLFILPTLRAVVAGVAASARFSLIFPFFLFWT